MKIRKGFVSNSSSSSFICDVCGNIEAGWDMSLDEAYMVECTKGHTFCESHVVDKEAFGKYKETEEYEYGYGIPDKFCPICTFEKVKKDDILKALIKILDLKGVKEAEQMILDRFESYEELQEFLKD
jgi:hypothetical protein